MLYTLRWYAIFVHFCNDLFSDWTSTSIRLKVTRGVMMVRHFRTIVLPVDILAHPGYASEKNEETKPLDIRIFVLDHFLSYLTTLNKFNQSYCQK